MRKIILVLIAIFTLISACSSPPSSNSQQETQVPVSEDPLVEDPAPTAEIPPSPEPTAVWPPVSGPQPSTRMAAFYYPWYFTPEFDGVWEHWEGFPPSDISSDYYPALGPYSMSDPEVLAQHFAWLRQAGVGLIISSWWGKYDSTDKALPLMLDIADHYGIKIAFHIEPYSGRSAANLMRDIRYIYQEYGSHPAFYWTTETSRYSPDNQPKGLFFLWATVVSDEDRVVAEDYWKDALDTLHAEDPGAIVITDQNDPAWVRGSHFDGSYKYGVLDADPTGYDFARALPLDTWYIAGVNPGFSARRIGGETWTDTPRRDGDTYNARWESMFEMGIEPEMVAVTTFNEWHEGTQIEPAIPGMDRQMTTYPYLDYEPLEPEAYLDLTRDWSEVFLAYEWPESTTMRLHFRTTSDWTDLHLISGASWQRPEWISVSEEANFADMSGGYLALGQPLDKAELGHSVEAILEIQFREEEGDAPLVFMIERGGLGASWVELYRQSGEEWLLADSFWWAGQGAGGRNAANFEVAHEAIFGEGP